VTLKKRSDDNSPSPRYLLQDLAARFGVLLLFSAVAHPERNRIEIFLGTVKMALKRANMIFSPATLRGMAEVESAKIT